MRHSIKFKKIPSTEPLVDYVSAEITTRLNKGQKILWLLSGGSFINAQVAIANKLSGFDCSKLTVSLTDERYRPVGHPDSNWQKLLVQGFRLKSAKLEPVLRGKSFNKTTKDFSDFLSKELYEADYKIACVGVGVDGHTLGVLRNSPVVNSKGIAVGYEATDFKRITMTLGSLSMLDEITVSMFGVEKHKLINQLANENIDLANQPAQILKQLKKVTVYNDYLSL